MDTKALRQKILDLAIRGKLVPQDPNDEPASVLLERIRAEKERLIAEGKIKRPKSLTKGRSCSENAKTSSSESHYRKFTPPFEIPDSWEWVKLEDVCSVITDGDHQAPPKVEKGIPFLVISDVVSGDIKFDKCRFVPESYYDSIPDERKAKIGDILFTVTGSYGIPIKIVNSKNFCFQRHIGLIKPIFINDWIFLFLQSDFCKKCCDEKATGTAQKTVSLQILREFVIPLPPYEEQKRIIKDFIKWDENVNNIGVSKGELGCIISATKSKILELAMQGKLVPQDPADEAAADMLRRINPKARIITDNPHSWNIPESWVWVRIKDIFNPMERCIPNGITFKYIDIDSIDNKKNIAYPKEIQSNNAPSRASRKTNKGNVVFSMVRPYLRNIAVVTEEDCIASTGFYVLNPTSAIDENFTFMLALAPYFVDGLNSYMKGDNSPSINKNNVEDFIIGLPPLNEQKRIVTAIEEVYAVLDKIEASLQS